VYSSKGGDQNQTCDASENISCSGISVEAANQHQLHYEKHLCALPKNKGADASASKPRIEAMRKSNL